MDDTISRSKTLDAFADYVGGGMSMNDFDALWEIVEKMPPAREWSPVSERLPEVDENGNSEWVLVTTEGIDKTATMYDRLYHGRWLTPCFDEEKVTAWMPFPKPYKAEKGEPCEECECRSDCLGIAYMSKDQCEKKRGWQ